MTIAIEDGSVSRGDKGIGANWQPCSHSAPRGRAGASPSEAGERVAKAGA